MSRHDDDELDFDLDLDLSSLDELELDQGAEPESAADGADVADAPAAPPTDAADTVPDEVAGQPASVEVLAPGAAGGPAATGEPDRVGPSPLAAPESVADAPAAAPADSGEVEGQWVWQYAAPPPPASFGAVFFSGRALSELYRFFVCGLLVFIGCLLPWGRSMEWVVEHGESTLAYAPPAGYELTWGAISMALALWLIGVSCYGIYTGRQKILPVFLMLIPAWITWDRMLVAWGLTAELGMKHRLAKVSEVAGTGVLLALVGSSIVALQLVLVVIKVLRKQPAAEGGTAGRSRKSKQPKGEQEPVGNRASKKERKNDSKKDRKKDRQKDRAKDGRADEIGAAEIPKKNEDGERGPAGGRRAGRKR